MLKTFSNVQKVLLICAAIMALASLLYGLVYGMLDGGDMKRVYTTTRIILHGENPYLMRINGNLTEYARDTTNRVGVELRADYFPSAYFPLIPLAVFPLPVFKVIWLMITLASLAILIWAIRSFYDSALDHSFGFYLIICIWITGNPVCYTLILGQTTLFSLAMILTSIVCHKRRRNWLSGIFLAFALTKYTLVWPLVLFFFMLNHAWRPLILAFCIHLALHLLLSWHIGVGPIEVLTQALIDNSRIFYRDGILTFWSACRGLGELFPHIIIYPEIIAGVLLISMLASLAVVWKKYKDNINPLAWVSIFSVLSVLTVATQKYSFVFLLANATWVLTAKVPSNCRWLRVRIFCYLLLISMIQHPWIYLFLEQIKSENFFYFENWKFNVILFVFCVESVWLFIREMRASRIDPAETILA